MMGQMLFGQNVKLSILALAIALGFAAECDAQTVGDTAAQLVQAGL